MKSNQTQNNPKTLTCAGDASASNCVNSASSQYSCVAATLECPETTALNVGAPMTITTNHTSTQCKYTLGCVEGYTLSGGDETITCTNISTCNTAISNYTCTENEPTPTFECPSVPNGWDSNGTLAAITSGSHDCNYKLTCNDNFVVVNTGSSNSTTFGCDGGECTSSWLSDKHDDIYCRVICQSPQDLSDILTNGNFGNDVTHVGNNKCRYTLGCDDGYILQGATNPYICTGAGCKKSSIRTYVSEHYSCDAVSTCPAVGTLPQPSNASLESLGKEGDTCEYRQTCNHGYKLNNGNSIAIAECDGDECSDDDFWYDFYRDHKCSFTCPSGNELPTLAHATLSLDDQTGTVCEYRQICASGYKLITDSSYAYPECNGDECLNASFFTNYYNEHQCYQACPDASSFSHDDHVVIIGNSPNNPLNCKYTVNCDNNTDYTLYKNSIRVSAPATEECSSASGNCGTTLFSTYWCLGTCPESIGQGGVVGAYNSHLSDHTICAYDLECDNVGQTLTGSPNPMSVRRDVGMSQIQNLANGMLSNYSCDY